MMPVNHTARRLITVAAVLCVPLSGADAATHYVDTGRGKDTNDGTLARPWRTLQKAADAMAAGDVALVRAGTYRETATPRSGQTFAAYQDEKPLITGCDPVDGWTVHAGKVFRAKANSTVYDVFVGGSYMQKARWPNEDGDPLTVGEWAKTTNRLVPGTTTGKVDFAGADLPACTGGWYSGIHGNLPYMPAEGRISAIDGSEITVAEVRDSAWTWTHEQHAGAGVGYVTDHLSCLDADGEWHWQEGTLYLQAPGGGLPVGVEARTRILGFIMDGVDDVALRGLYFQGASVHVNGGSHCTVDACHFRHVSPWGTAGADARLRWQWGTTEDGTSGIEISGSDHEIKNCSVVGGWGNAIRLEGGNNLRVTNNYVENVGWLGRFILQPISGYGTDLYLEHNTVKRCANAGIVLVQKNPGDGSNVNHVKHPYIRHNYFSDTGYLLGDGNAFIYINNDDVPSADRGLDGEIAYNLGVGNRSRFASPAACGIYIDNGTDFVSIHHNVLNLGNPTKAGVGIFLHGAQHVQENIFCYHNTCWGYSHHAIATSCWGRDDGPYGKPENVVFRNNLGQTGEFRATAIGGPGLTSDHNLSGIPVIDFLDPGNSDFRLRDGAAAIDAGVVIPGINDADSASPFAGDAPDLGACEHGRPPWTAGSTVSPPAFPTE